MFAVLKSSLEASLAALAQDDFMGAIAQEVVCHNR